MGIYFTNVCFYNFTLFFKDLSCKYSHHSIFIRQQNINNFCGAQFHSFIGSFTNLLTIAKNFNLNLKNTTNKFKFFVSKGK